MTANPNPHNTLRRVRGSASLYRCVDCGKQARDWSHTHKTDPDDIDNYHPRCAICHKQYDKESYWENEEYRKKQLAMPQRQSSLSEDQKEQLVTLYATGKYTQKQLAERFGVCQKTISIWTRKGKR